VDRALAERLRAETRLLSVPLLPELVLHLITEECRLWRGSEADAAQAGLPEPYWAFCWPGGQALARHLLDHPDLVRGKRVLDFGSGGAVEGLAALRSGAASLLCADLDPVAGLSARLNLAANPALAPLAGRLSTTTEDLVGQDVDAEVVLAGDVFYDKDLAARGRAWLERLAGQGKLVLLGDPARGFLDTAGLLPVASYVTAGDGDATGAQQRTAWAYRAV
jgi:predicted nicotinamide N-methyase